MEDTTNIRKRFDAKIESLSGKNTAVVSLERYELIIARLVALARGKRKEKTNSWDDYRLLKQYAVEEIDLADRTVRRLRKPGINKYYVNTNEIFDIIHGTHILKGHCGRNILEHDLRNRYVNITRDQIVAYLQLCEKCTLKKSSLRKSIVVKPILSKDFNSKCQVDLIDYQSSKDDVYKYILVYQDHLTKLVRLRALKDKSAVSVAHALVGIFCELGAPCILHTDNGREFANAVIKELVSYWPECRLVHGKPRHSQSQGSVERANRDVEALVTGWLKDHNCKEWSEALNFVQWQKNSRLHSGIGSSPYEAVFGNKPHLGLEALNLPQKVVEKLESEEELRKAMGVEDQMNTGAGEGTSNNDNVTENVVSVTAEFNSVRSKLENMQRENENLNNQLSVARCECTSLQQTVARMSAETMYCVS